MEITARETGVQVFCLSGGYGHIVNLYVFGHSGNLLSVKTFMILRSPLRPMGLLNIFNFIHDDVRTMHKQWTGIGKVMTFSSLTVVRYNMQNFTFL